MCHVFSPSRAVLSAILRDEYLTSAVRTRKIALKTARDGEKTWHMTQLTFSSNFYWNICFKFCILVLFLCISSINNKRSSLRFQSTTAPTNRGWSACGPTFSSLSSLARACVWGDIAPLNLQFSFYCCQKFSFFHLVLYTAYTSA